METTMSYARRVSFLGSITAALLVLIAPLMPAYAASGSISTVAGGYIGDGGPATSARINNPAHLAVSADGTKVYIVDTYNQRIRMVSTTTGSITTVAGNGIAAFAGDDGPATAASINEANGVAVDTAGNIYIADSFNQRIRKVIYSTGTITTIAGTGAIGTGSHNGENMAATSATLFYPYSVTTTTTGVIYIADSNNNRVRRIQTDGTISTIAGSSTATFGGDSGQAWDALLNYPTDVAVDSVGNIYIADTNNHRIRKIDIATNIITTVAGNGTAAYTGNGGQATLASLNAPYGVLVDPAGNIYIADTYNNVIRMVNTAGNIDTIAGSYYGYAGDGGPATGAAMRYPAGIARDSAGNLYISDQFNDCIRKVTPGGIISTIAGSPINLYNPASPGPTASNAVKLNYAHGVGASPSGNVYIADTKNSIVRIISAATGSVTTIAGTGTEGSAGDNGPALSAQLNNPYGVTADASGNVYIADSYNHMVRKVTPGGLLTTVAGDGTTAVLSSPRSVATDTLGNLYIADTDHNQVKKVTFPAGTISLVAGDGSPAYGGDDVPGGATYAKLNTPTGVAVDTAGNVFIADSSNNRIRKVTPSGTISTVAGNGTYGYSGDSGAATSAQLATPYGVAVDAAGNLYIADFYNSRVRKVDASGTISTLLGNGIQSTIDIPVTTNIFVGFAGDGGFAAPDGYSILYNPYSVAVDAAGNLYIADVNNWRIRKVATTLPPSLSAVHIASNNTNTSRAKAGDTVAVTFTSSQIISTPTVTIAGRTATVTGGGTSWSASIVMTGSDPQGMISFSITYKNLSNIPGTPVTSTTDSSIVTFDSVAPTVAISAPSASAVKSGATVTYTVTYTGADSVTLANATLNTTGSATGTVVVSGSGTASRLVTISSITGNGTLGISIAAASASDLAGNTALASGPSATFSVDNIAPTVAISAPSASAVKSGATVTYTVTYTGADSVTLATAALNATGTATGTVAVSGTGTASRLVTISSITGNGTLGISIAAGTASDLAGNTAAASGPSTTFNVDSIAPTLVVSGPSSTLTNAGPVTYTVDYTGADSVTLVNANITLNTSGTATGTVAVSGTGTLSRLVTITSITGNGTLGISIAAGTASDLAGNTAAAAGPTATFNVDNSAPTAAISAPSASAVKSGATVTYTVTYTGADSVTLANATLNVTGSATGTVVVSGSGTASRLVTISSITGNGTLGISIAAATASDLAGNAASAAGPSTTFIVDSIAPTLVVSGPSSTLTNAGPVTYTVDYTGADSVTLVNANVTLNTSGTANGTVVVSGSGTLSRLVTISSITGNGTLGISIAAATASDLAGNTAAAAGPGATFNVDNSAPTVAISAPSASAVKSGATVTYTVTYNGADSVTLATAALNATGTATGTIAVSGSGTASRLVTISGITGNGTLGISIAAGTASDLAGNTAAAAGPSTTFSVDSIAPTVTLTSTALDPTNAPFPVTVTFNEAVTGFTIDDVVVVNSAVGAFGGTGTIYTFTVTPTLNGAVTVNVAAGVAQDAAGNGNTAALQLSRTFDSVNPTVVITSTAPNSTNVSPIPVTVTFSKAVTGFTSGDVVVTNGTVGAFTGSGTTYNFNILPSGQGAITVNVAADVAQDSAANGNLAAVQLTRTYDNVAPTTLISSTAPNFTNVSPIPMTVTFSEAVTGFASDDVAIGNGAIIGLITAVSGTTYTFDVAPTAEGAVTVNVAAGKVQDAAGNFNSAATQLARTYDSTQPTVTISSLASSQTRTSPIPVTVTFSEAVAGFTVNSVSVTNGTKGSFAGSGANYTFNVLPIAEGPVTVNVAANVAFDPANNGNGPALQLTRTYDTTAPTLAISAPSLSTANNGVSVTYTVTYTGADTVTLTTGNVTLNKTLTANGSVVVSGSGNAWTVTISNITGFDGTLGITIAANTASDLAGNLAASAGPSATFSVDNASGDLNGSGVLEMTDALKALRIAVGLDTPTASEIAHGDVAPLLNGARQPDGKISSADVVAILRKVVLLPSW
jgi:sugar lactone lactonase YvrE